MARDIDEGGSTPASARIGNSSSSSLERKPAKVSLFLRLTRFQFIPLVILPALVGTSLSLARHARFNVPFFCLVMVGVILLHLGANAIDDCYDFQNGVDQVANSMFPSDFEGWKPIPRGYISLRSAKFISFALFGSSLVIGAYLWYSGRPLAFFLALAGFLLALFYCAPPLKLDYRGMGLGEIAIFFSFGPIPVLGAYYVQTGLLSLQALLLSIPVGIMTVTILVDHDLIFYEVYQKSKKMSLGTVLGRKNTLRLSLGLTIASYAFIIALVAARVLPPWTVLAPMVSACVLFLRKGGVFLHPNEPPPYYASFTANGMLSNWLFALLISLSLLT